MSLTIGDALEAGRARERNFQLRIAAQGVAWGIVGFVGFAIWFYCHGGQAMLGTDYRAQIASPACVQTLASTRMQIE